MTLTLVIAILFTLAALGSLFYRKGKTWWMLTLVLVAGAVINWLRWSGTLGW